MPEYVCAFEITCAFTDEEVAHNPDPEEVMATLVRRVTDVLKTINGPVGNITFERLCYSSRSGWETALIDGVEEGSDGSSTAKPMVLDEQWLDPETGNCDYCDNIDVAVRPDDQQLLICRRCAEHSDAGDG